MQVDGIIKEFLLECTIKGFSPRTIKSYRNNLCRFERIVRIAGEKAEIDDKLRCSPHTCRHYFAQAQVKNGCDIYTLSRLLGHSNIKITQTYLNSMKNYDIIDKAMRTSPLLNLK